MSRQVKNAWRLAGVVVVGGLLLAGGSFAGPVRTQAGMVKGTASGDGKIEIFKGVPFAAPPIGTLRWKEAQPVRHWKGTRNATAFGPRCMQGAIYSDMVFRDAGPSEDCLYLNVWAPKISSGAKLPVMVWIYGGGFQAGATSEPRQDGEQLARLGVVVVSMNYRLGIFGLFAHPELTKESPHHASGNYGLLDQAASLKWVRENIAAFGGDANNVTIFGESAGSFSVSALMASPVAKDLIHTAIGESGAFFGRTLRAKGLGETEKEGAKFAESVGANSLKALRAMDAEQLLSAALSGKNKITFEPNIDGYFLPKSTEEIYAAGEQAHVPLMAGWNRDESSYRELFGKDQPSRENYETKMKQFFGDAAAEALKIFPATTDEEMKQSAGLLSGAEFIAYGTWKWMEMQRKTGDAAIFRYEFDQAPPRAGEGSPNDEEAPAYHSAEIEFVFGTLDAKNLTWREEDYKVSKQMGAYWTNFAKTGNPNGVGAADWPRYEEKTGYTVMHLSANPQATSDQHRAQFEFLDKTPVKERRYD